MRQPRAWVVPLSALLAAAGAIRILYPFDGLYGQDAFAYFHYAVVLWPHLSTGVPLPDLYWPIGYPITLALFLPLTGGGPLAGQIVSAVACGVAAAATCQLTRRLRQEDGSSSPDTVPELMSGLVLAWSGASLRSSQVVMADGLALGAAAVALLCAVNYAHTRKGAWLVGGASAVAWGTASRWLVGLLALPFGAFLAADQWGRRRQPSRLHENVLPWALAAAVASLGILVPQFMIAHSVPASLEKHEWLVGWSMRNALKRDFHTPEGYAHYRLPPCLFYLARLGWPDYFFPLLVPFVLAGSWILVRERRWAHICLFLGWPAAVWLFLSGIPYENPRFLLPTLPSIAALFGIGYARIRAVPSLRGRVLADIVVVASIAAGLGFGLREHGRLVSAKNADRELVEWVRNRLPAEASLLATGPTLAFEHYAALRPHDLFSAGDAELDLLTSNGNALFLLADVDELERQWVGLAPQQNFERLRRRPGLAIVGTHPPFTLFRVGARE